MMNVRSLEVPTVSIITPSYNQGEFIAETIVSVLSQPGDFYLDYLIMDGGSTDDSVEIIKKYEELLESGAWPIACRGIAYRWSSGKDGGQADALNKGFALAKGEILGWLNSDDTYLPGAVTKAVEHLIAHPASVMVYGNAHYTDRGGIVTGSYPSEKFSLKRLAENCFICQPAGFFRKAALIEVGGLDSNLQASMDYELWIRMGKRFDGRIDFIEDYLANSRMYQENKTSSLRDVVYKETMTMAKKHFGYVEGSWVVDSIYEVLQGADAKSLSGTLKNLVHRLLVLRHFVNLKTIKSVVFLLLTHRKKRLSHKP